MNIDFKSLREKVEKIDKAGEIENLLEHDTCYSRFKETALEMPDAIAINYFGNEMTYRQMITLIDELAKGFALMGIKKDEVVTMSMLSTPYGIASFYALDKIGASMHMVNSASSLEEIKREFSNFNSKYFIANDIFCGKEVRDSLKEIGVEKIITSSLVDSIPMGLNIDKSKYKIIEMLKGVKKREYYKDVTLIDINEVLESGRSSDICVVPCEYEKNHMATIAYTSGSTGNSKACVGTWDGIDSMVQVMAMTEQGRFDAGDVMLTTFPLWIYYSLLNMIHEPLCLGVTLALDPLFDPKNLARRNEQYKFNHWLTIPPYIKQVLAMNKDMDCSRWKIVLTGGAELDNDVKLKADKYIARNGGTTEVVQGYGFSEGLGSLAYCYYPNSALGSLGKPCIGNMLKIIDPVTGEELGPNQSGIGYFYSPSLMREYYGDKKSTDEVLIEDENGVKWYNTGDYLHVNDNGEIFFEDRIRRIVITIGSDNKPNKLIPAKTTKAILNHVNQVDKCEVITVPDEKIENKAIAFIVLKNGVVENETLKENIKDICSMNVPEYMVPKEVIFIDAMPLNSNKKPNLKKLEEMYKNGMCQQEVKSKSKVKQLFKRNK